MRDLKVHSRFSNRVFGLVVLAGLIAGVAVSPLRMAAQEASAGQAAPSPSVARPDAAKPDAAQSEEEQQNNAFRLEGPVVKWTAVLALVVSVSDGVRVICPAAPELLLTSERR